MADLITSSYILQVGLQFLCLSTTERSRMFTRQ
nr:MAG TPA: hypothetical protein [Caudoviricetes sp.]